jgi:hypothetical protein
VLIANAKIVAATAALMVGRCILTGFGVFRDARIDMSNDVDERC